MSFNLHLRGVDKETMYALKQKAQEQETSVNSLILLLLKRTLGLAQERQLNVYHDLDKFAGTWGKREAKTFLQDISDFEQIDKEIWK